MTTRKQKFQINIHIRIEEKSVSAVLFIFVLAGYVNFMSMFFKVPFAANEIKLPHYRSGNCF